MMDDVKEIITMEGAPMLLDKLLKEELISQKEYMFLYRFRRANFTEWYQDHIDELRATKGL